MDLNLVTLRPGIVPFSVHIYCVVCIFLLVSILQFFRCFLLVQGALRIQDHILIGAYRRANMKT